MKRLRLNKRGVSNVIVIMLSLVLVVIVVANVILWSYQMNQLDWERIQEKIELTNTESLTRSSWSTTEEEYATNVGTKVSGAYTDTQIVNGTYETFRESNTTQDSYGLDLTGACTLNLTAYPRTSLNSLEIQIRYRASDSLERWFLKAYNWTKMEYSDAGFNTTAGDLPTSQFRFHTVNLTNAWQSYMQSNGTVRVKFCDMQLDANQTTVDIDFLGVRAVIDGARFSLRNQGSITCHVVAIWIVNSTKHERYSADFFLNSGAISDYVRLDISLPKTGCIVRVVTERGNIAISTRS